MEELKIKSINEVEKTLDKLSSLVSENSLIDSQQYAKYDVKRGLRNSNGTGVLVGLTKVSDVQGYEVIDGEKVPALGKLFYRGLEIQDIVKGFQKEKRFGFEETCYLLLFGKLPTEGELTEYKSLIEGSLNLPSNFLEDMILKAPSSNIMNKLQRSVLVLYSYDKNPDDVSIRNVLRQSIELIARFPSMVSYGYQAKAHYFSNKSLYIHSPKKELSTAENLLYMTRGDSLYTKAEAEVLDLALVLHADHGGGNNSAFATHVVSSTGTDTYSAVAAAIGSLKGPKHGGANIKVMEMIKDIKENVKDYTNEALIESYIKKILDKKAFDGSGLIYGMGHAIYTLSDPRATLLKEKALELAIEKGRAEEFKLYENIENITKNIFINGDRAKAICANVDLYSGFVYDMLNINEELYTPIFAAARIAGWCAHRMEQLISEPKIIRPAYRSVTSFKSYTPLNSR